jgi:PPOX class probable FMN-dependent enzyme
MTGRFTEILTTEAQLREVLGVPTERVVRKQIPYLDAHCRAFIAKSPFLLLATYDADGNVDVSPKGDPAGFVRVLDDTTLAIPDRPGNRRADSFRNLVVNPSVGILFMIPGKQETLRVSGTAVIVRDRWLRDELALDGKVPELVLAVTVREAFLHCPKCILRSRLWDKEHWPDLSDLPSLAQSMVDAGRLSETVAEMQALIDKDTRERLY